MMISVILLSVQSGILKDLLVPNKSKYFTGYSKIVLEGEITTLLPASI